MEKIKPGDKPKGVNDVVVTCMDYRFHEVIRDLLNDEHGVDIDHADQLSIGGSSLGITDESLGSSLEIAYKEHGARRAFVFDHTDCGGFGTLEAFDNDEQKEAQAHFEKQDQAREILSNLFPELVVVTYVMGLSGEPIER